jgi:hypothetical protein
MGSNVTTQQKACPICGATFTPRTKWNRYCSRRCRYKDWVSKHPRDLVKMREQVAKYRVEKKERIIAFKMAKEEREKNAMGAALKGQGATRR